jgi:simple sugar transport system ATP-binding protein
LGPVRALADVNLVLYPGEVIGLVGDNSAGKSTLMKILTGAYQRDSGEILVNGEPVNFRSPHDSRDRGIEMIYQDFALCGNMNVAQNIFLGRWPRKGPFIDRTKMYADADEVLQRLKVNVNSVYQKVESLSGGRQQSVAIARAISFNPRVVILDEPTANLSVMATERLLETMLELKRQGVAQIIISHRLTDIFAVGDRVMVLKRGENVGDRYVKNTNEHECWRSSCRVRANPPSPPMARWPVRLESGAQWWVWTRLGRTHKLAANQLVNRATRTSAGGNPIGCP